MHKKYYIGPLFIVAGIIGIWQLANAATTWQGPPTGCYYPNQTDCNTDGVVWNRLNPEDANVPANSGGFKVQGKAIINSDVKGYGDFYIPDTKSIRVDKAGNSIVKIGNWGGTGQWKSDLVVYGDLKVEQKGTMPVPQLHTPWLCLGNPGSEDCRNVWPAGGGGGSGTVTSVGSGNGLTGGPITTAGTLSVMTCTNGQVLKSNASNQWYCGTDNSGGSGTISTINSPDTSVSVTNPSGPTTSLSLNTTLLDGRYVNVTGDNMTGKLAINASIFGTTFEAINNLYTNQWHWGGTFTANGALGVGVSAEGQHYGVQANGDTFGIYADTDVSGGYGGYFKNNVSGNEASLGGQSYSVLAYGPAYFGSNIETYGLTRLAYSSTYGNYLFRLYPMGSGGQYIKSNGAWGHVGSFDSSGDITSVGSVRGTSLCIGSDCRGAWPAGGGSGDITAVYAGNGLTGGSTVGDATVNVGAGTGIQSNADDVQILRSYQLPQTCSHGQTATRNAQIVAGVQQNFWECANMPTGDIGAVYAGANMYGGGSSGDVTLNVYDNWVNTTGDTMSGYLTVNGSLSSASQIESTGGLAGYSFKDRANNGFANWVWYAYNLQPRLWNSATGDVLTMNTAGLLWLKGGLTANGDIYTTGSITSGGDSFKTTAGDIPILTKYYDPFASTAGVKYGHGRWGMFMEPGALNIGIPNLGTSNREFQVSRYATNGSRDILLALRSDNGNFYVPVGNMYTKGVLVTSDVRLKKDISQLSKGLESVMSLIPVSYKFKTQKDDDQKNFGFIAQQVDTVLPDLVRLDSETGYYHISYEGVIPVTVKAIQEQQAEIEDLKAKNQELEARLQRLEALIK